MRRVIHLITAGLYLLVLAWAIPMLSPQQSTLPKSSALSPQSITHSIDDLVQVALINIHKQAFKESRNKRLPYSIRPQRITFEAHPLYHLDPESIYAVRHHFGLEVSFRYTDLEKNENYLMEYLVEKGDEEYFFTLTKKTPLRSFKTIQESITFDFRSEDSYKDKGSSAETKKPPRVGDHKKIILTLLSDPTFMQETLDNIYGKREYNVDPVSSRPRHILEIGSLHVTEDDIGSQKQAYRVDVTMLNGEKISPFALKIGINAQNCAKFRAEELDYLKKLRPSKTVPTFGSQAIIPAFDISEGNKELYDRGREEKDRGTAKEAYTVEAYTETYIEGTTFGQGVNLVRYDSLDHYEEILLFQKLGIPVKKEITPEDRAVLATRPKRAIENVKRDILNARNKSSKHTLPILDKDYLLKHHSGYEEHFIPILTTWIQAAAYLSDDLDYHRTRQIRFISDMQRLNIMYTLVKGHHLIGLSKYTFSDELPIGNPTIIDVGNVVEDRASVFIASLFKQYFGYFKNRMLGRVDSKNIASFFQKWDMVDFVEDLDEAFGQAHYYKKDQQWLRLAMTELSQGPDFHFLRKFMPLYTNPETKKESFKLLQIKGPTSKERAEQTNRFWRVLTFVSLYQYFAIVDNLPTPKELQSQFEQDYFEIAI